MRQVTSGPHLRTWDPQERLGTAVETSFLLTGMVRLMQELPLVFNCSELSESRQGQSRFTVERLCFPTVLQKDTLWSVTCHPILGSLLSVVNDIESPLGMNKDECLGSCMTKETPLW